MDINSYNNAKTNAIIMVVKISDNTSRILKQRPKVTWIAVVKVSTLPPLSLLLSQLNLLQSQHQTNQHTTMISKTYRMMRLQPSTMFPLFTSSFLPRLTLMPPVASQSHRLDLGTLITWSAVTMATYMWKQCKRVRHHLYTLPCMSLPFSIGPAMDPFPLLSA